ncbi:MAG: ACP S-malonyltransferase [Burkholderiales bacterium]|nr:ACP S-malonyltransferase [Burkholderiales bacterium]
MKYAFVFPGQGSQSVGMMKGFDSHPVVRETFEEGSDILGQDLWKMITEGAPEELNLTVNTQPLMLAAGVATYRAWNKVTQSRPTVLAGHSLGEYTALVASNAIAFHDALPLVRFRAESMQRAVPEGAGGIAAILGLEDDAIRAVCQDAAEGGVLEAVNYNSPGQVVIAGDRAAVERGMALAKERGAKRALLLPMSVPSHCSLMKPAADALGEYLKDVKIEVPQIPVLHNVDVSAHADPDEIRKALVAQLHNPVRWVETIRMMAQQGIGHVAECAPGKVLAGLNKRIESSQIVLAMPDGAALEDAATTLGGNHA